MHFAKKLTALFSCLSLLMLHPIALANEECFDLDGVVLSSHSDAEAIRKLTEIRNSMDKFFLAKGGDRIPPRISHEMALDLARFLALEGFTHIQLVGGQPQTQDERNTWEVFGGTILKNSDWDGPKIKKFNAGIKKFFLAKGMREIPASISSEVYLALIDFLVLEGFTKDELIGESDDTEKVPWKIFEHIAFNHSDIQNNPKIKKLKSSMERFFLARGEKEIPFIISQETYLDLVRFLALEGFGGMKLLEQKYQIGQTTWGAFIELLSASLDTSQTSKTSKTSKGPQDIKPSVAKFFAQKGENEVPQTISRETAVELIDFLAAEGFQFQFAKVDEGISTMNWILGGLFGTAISAAATGIGMGFVNFFYPLHSENKVAKYLYKKIGTSVATRADIIGITTLAVGAVVIGWKIAESGKSACALPEALVD